MTGKFALVIGNTEYADAGLAQLTAPSRDAEDFARVLKDRGICSFDEVNVLLNQPESAVREAIDEFFDQKKPDDLLVLYFSGHGVRDELGSLYLAVKNTTRSRLRSTAIKSDYIREVMDQSRSRRQLLILDCCNSGAFAQGTKAATGLSIGIASAFESGYGRIILTASDSTQFAWEGDKVIGETDNSLFTHYLVEGLEGEADLDGDGRITVDELYDYAYEKVKLATPKQTPSKFSSKQQGEIILRQNMPMDEIKSVPLPTPLLDSIENPFADIRFGAVQQLTKLLKGKNLGLARSAREALERIAEDDDSRQVQRAARQALESAREVEKPTRGDEPEIITKEAQRIIHKRAAEAERSEKERAERFAAQKIDAREEFSKPVMEKTTASIPNQQAVLWITLGWIISGLFAGYLWSEFDDARGEVIAGIIGGGGGGFITAFILRSEKILSDQISTFRIVLAWAIGGAIGWLIGWVFLSEVSGAGIGMAVFAIIGLVSTLGMDYIRVNWKSVAGITAAWWLGGAIGWSISKGLIDKLGAGPATSWAIGTAIGWAIGGYVLGWQLLKDMSDNTNESKVTNSSEPSQIKLTETQIAFLLSPLGRTILGITVGLILGIFYGISYGRIEGITYDFAYAYTRLIFPHGILLITCGLAGLIAYPHRWTILLMIGGFIVFAIARGQGYLLYDLTVFGGIFGLPTGALISRVLFWLKVINASDANANVTNSPTQNKSILTESQKAFLLSWKGRSLIGGAVGIILGITYKSVYLYSDSEVMLGSAVVCSLAGLMTYPHKLSIGLLIAGFWFAASNSEPLFVVGSEALVTAGAFFGFLGGALLSRILYLLKIIK